MGCDAPQLPSRLATVRLLQCTANARDLSHVARARLRGFPEAPTDNPPDTAPLCRVNNQDAIVRRVQESLNDLSFQLGSLDVQQQRSSRSRALSSDLNPSAGTLGAQKAGAAQQHVLRHSAVSGAESASPLHNLQAPDHSLDLADQAASRLPSALSSVPDGDPADPLPRPPLVGRTDVSSALEQPPESRQRGRLSASGSPTGDVTSIPGPVGRVGHSNASPGGWRGPGDGLLGEAEEGFRPGPLGDSIDGRAEGTEGGRGSNGAEWSSEEGAELERRKKAAEEAERVAREEERREAEAYEAERRERRARREREEREAREAADRVVSGRGDGYRARAGERLIDKGS